MLTFFRFGNEVRDALSAGNSKYVPGPGNYSTAEELGKTAPKFSFGKEERGTNKRPMTPGPGQYQHKTTVGSGGPKFSMPNGRPQSSASSHRTVPGPGQYSANMNDKVNAPSFRIGSAKRGDNNKFLEANPGPGQYAPNSNTSIRPKSPVWSMGTGTRQALSPTEMVPGPGNYNASSTIGGPKVNKLNNSLKVFNAWQKSWKQQQS